MGTSAIYATLRDLIISNVDNTLFYAPLYLVEEIRRFERFGITRCACFSIGLRFTHDGIVHGNACIGGRRYGLP